MLNWLNTCLSVRWRDDRSADRFLFHEQQLLPIITVMNLARAAQKSLKTGAYWYARRARRARAGGLSHAVLTLPLAPAAFTCVPVSASHN